jgi:hypothetical protein
MAVGTLYFCLPSFSDDEASETGLSAQKPLPTVESGKHRMRILIEKHRQNYVVNNRVGAV